MAGMEPTVLMDNNTYIDRYYLGEPAACYLLETEGRFIPATARPSPLSMRCCAPGLT